MSLSSGTYNYIQYPAAQDTVAVSWLDSIANSTKLSTSVDTMLLLNIIESNEWMNQNHITNNIEYDKAIYVLKQCNMKWGILNVFLQSNLDYITYHNYIYIKCNELYTYICHKMNYLSYLYNTL